MRWWIAIAGVSGCALLADDATTPAAPTVPPVPTETHVTTPATFPTYLALGARFGWDAEARRVMDVVAEGEPISSGVRFTLGGDEWDLALDSPEACEVVISLAGRGPADLVDGEPWWLAIGVGDEPRGEHDCAGFDLGGFPDEDPVALLSTGPFAGWEVAIGGEPEPWVAADAEVKGIPAELSFGAQLSADGFRSAANLGRAFALDPDGELVLVDGERVALGRDEVSAEPGPPTAYYEVTHWLDYYLP